MVSSDNSMGVVVDTSAARAAVMALLDGLSGQFRERRQVLKGILLAIIAREHVLLLGPPGTAKSQMALAISSALGWRSFVRLMGAQTVPEELFGPYDLSGLTETPSRFERVVEDYLPTAELTFLDEIFKANTAILNSLLTALMERRYDNGTRRMQIPLEVCIGASNEGPQDDRLGALYDRFLVRYDVGYIRDEGEFSSMLLADEPAPLTLDPAAIGALRAAAAQVDIRPLVEVGAPVPKLRAELASEHGIQASDRRWRKAMGMVRAAAALDGSTVARPRHMAVLADCLWNRPEEADAIRALVAKVRSPNLHRAHELLQSVRELAAALPALETLKATEVPSASQALQQIRQAAEEARKLQDPNDSDPEIGDAIDEIKRTGTRLRNALDRAMTGASSSEAGF